MNGTREELLQNLSYVRSTMIKMQNTLAKYIELERNFCAKQKGIETQGAGNKAKITAVAICSTILVFCLLLSPFTGGFTEIVCAAIGLAFICVTQEKKDQKPFKLLRKIAFLVTILCFFGLFEIVMASLTSPLAFVLIIVLAGIIAGIIAAGNAIINRVNKNVAVKNEAIEESNRQVQQQRKAYYSQYEALQRELQNNTASWYPPDYYNIEAINFFINAVRNSRASTMQELVNLFETTKQHQEMMAYNKLQDTKLEQLIGNQQTISDQLSFTNMMQVASFFQRHAHYTGSSLADMAAHAAAGYAVGYAYEKNKLTKKK